VALDSANLDNTKLEEMQVDLDEITELSLFAGMK
jgi:hypothetical protein